MQRFESARHIRRNASSPQGYSVDAIWDRCHASEEYWCEVFIDGKWVVPEWSVDMKFTDANEAVEFCAKGWPLGRAQVVRGTRHNNDITVSEPLSKAEFLASLIKLGLLP